MKSVEHLKILSKSIENDFKDFVLFLGGGLFKSSKRICYDEQEDIFMIINEIDGSFQEIEATQLKEETNLLEGIEKECLFALVD